MENDAAYTAVLSASASSTSSTASSVVVKVLPVCRDYIPALKRLGSAR